MTSGDSAGNGYPNPIFSIGGTRTFSGMDGDYMDAGHHGSLDLTSGTVALSFSASHLGGRSALISKDGDGTQDGHFSVWVDYGALIVTLENDGDLRWLRVPDLVLAQDQTYHLALSFGTDGLMIWLNGELVAADPEWTGGIAQNERALVIGGSRAWRSSDEDDAHSLFEGEIGNVMVFDTQLAQHQVVALTTATDPALDDAARMAAALEDLMPVLGDLHHGSETLKEMLAEYGVNHHGHFDAMPKLSKGTNAGETLDGSDGNDGINGRFGDDSVAGKAGDDVLQGAYGNDTLNGGAGNDILDGGHGEDTLYGGHGNDLLISRADAREPEIWYDPNRDEGDPLGELTNGKLYPDQPIPADDALHGGQGADIFYFQTLINAKERYIEKHTREDGSINWHGVAGENDKLHDHWVDGIGNDVVLDYDRDEGDRIVIEGHTTQIASITYGDANGDGVMDHSVISLYSDQGNNGGAHNDDRLGTIKVYGDLVKDSDIEHTAKPAYGIVHTIDDLKEALRPVSKGTDSGPISRPDDLPSRDDLNINNLPDPVFAVPDTHNFSGMDGDYMDAGHHSSLDLTSGTVALSFSASHLGGRSALISKDGDGTQDGHFSVWVDYGALIVTLENDGDLRWLRVPDLVLAQDQTYHLALSFGTDGLMIWLNGELVAADPEWTGGIAQNERALVIGGSRAWRSSDEDDAHSLFEGEIGNVMVFDTQLAQHQVVALTTATDPALDDAARMAAALEDLMPVLGDLHHGSETLKEMLAEYGVNHHGHFDAMPKLSKGTNAGETLDGSDGNDGINGRFGDDSVAGKAGDDVLQGAYGNDTLNGGAGNDILDGGHGEDTLYGGHGNDLLISRADAREPEIWYDPNRDEGDPLGELTNGKLYPDQPIPADDALHGGQGADIFYFQTLINAKERYIEKHTREDGSINWHGVAGENDKLHDHWVDGIGNDVVLDYDRDEGDRIVIEGHTTQIASITYGDANGDGVMDHSVISLYSDQGNNGGAHNDDRLGTIKVYGDLVKDSDIEHTAKPAYGIVHTIDDLKEALRPVSKGTDSGPISRPDDLPSRDDLNINNLPDPVFAVPDTHNFSGELRAALSFDHKPGMELAQGTISFRFAADVLTDHQVLFSKDASGHGNGGHVAVYLDENGSIYARIQDAEKSYYIKAGGAVEAGVTYDFALSFDGTGVEVLLDGQRVAFDPDIVLDMSGNQEFLVVGANGWSSEPGQNNRIHSHFNGTISDFAIFDQKLEASQLLAAINGADGSTGTDGDDVLRGDAGNNLLEAGAGNDQIRGFDGNDELYGGAGNDSVYGGNGSDTLNGGQGRDNLFGGGGADVILAGSGADTVYAGGGNDTIGGAGGNDELWAGDGHDTVFGGAGNDTLLGSQGNDVLWGGDGENWLNGGAGNDTLRLGSDTDIIVFSDGVDQVFGFADDDLIDLSGNALITDFADLQANHLTGSGNAEISDGDGNMIILMGVEVNEIEAGDFLF